jgi:glycosyltransferase involved in cell wall biosynthesis
MHLGVDLEQFATDPYGSGIQRVLQYLAGTWPHHRASAEFVVPHRGRHALLTPEQAAELVGVAFAPLPAARDLRTAVADRIESFDPMVVRGGELLAIFDAWVLPEVSYLPSVLQRFELFQHCVPTVMIGYDALPMTEPGNYRFRPGTSAWVSEYFRRLATADAVVCISEYARGAILGRLRRDAALLTTIAHPGGDHVAAGSSTPPGVPRFLRLGTMEARKQPREILAGFRRAVSEGLSAQLVFIGGESASDEAINADVRAAVDEGIGVEWITRASDDEVRGYVSTSSAFLSIGVEGYGIPVLEAIRLGTPVLFDGIQPAAELMVGHGACRMAAGTEVELGEALHIWADTDRLAALRRDVDASRVPTWRDFSSRVVDAALAV